MKASLACMAMAVAVGALLAGAQPAAADTSGGAAISAAAERSAADVVLSDREIAALAAREALAPQLADFCAGGPDTTTIVAWTGLGVGVTAFILALIAL